MYYDEKTAARLMNALLAASDSNRPALQHAWINAHGQMCACDGFRAYRLNVPVAGVPDIEAEKGIDFAKLYPEKIDEKKALDLPTLADVKAMIAEDKRNAKRGQTVSGLFTFGTSEDGDQLPVVNAAYLADLLTLFPDARAYYTSITSPIVFKSENGDALLLPVRVGENSEIDITKRRQAPAIRKKDKTPALGLRTFAALYAQ